jgi:hypothetical protein
MGVHSMHASNIVAAPGINGNGANVLETEYLSRKKRLPALTSGAGRAADTAQLRAWREITIQSTLLHWSALCFQGTLPRAGTLEPF